MLWWYVKLRFTMWVLRVTGKALSFALAAVALTAAAPVTIVTAVALAGAWLRGWPPSRLRRAAAWSLPMTAVYLTGSSLHAGSWRAVAGAPARDWHAAWHAIGTGNALAAFIYCAPVAVPLGLLIASWIWAWRIYSIETGLAGQMVTAPVVFDERQWGRASRAARGRTAAPGTVPLTDARGRIVMGAVIRSVGTRWRPVLALDWRALSRHQVIIGTTGTGKTNLMMRTWAGWYTAAAAAARRGERHRPLLIVLDCKGGPDARVKAGRTRRLLHACGARRVAIWPDEAAVSLWTLPPRDLAVMLFQLLPPVEGPAAFYGDVAQEVLTLACTAPAGPPAGAKDFLSRLDSGWLAAAWAGDPDSLAAVKAAASHMNGILLRYKPLMGRLGAGFEGTGRIGDADAWYFILEGTREKTVAEQQAMALIELIAHAATSPHGRPRTIMLAVDDYSAISGRVPMWTLAERGRSLGISVQVSAQSWHGLGASEDERQRIAATADGGIWLMRTPAPEPVSRLAGTRRVIETAHKLIGNVWGDEGSSRVQHAWTADPGIARRLAVGQAGYIHAGTCVWVQIARPVPSPLALPAEPQQEPAPEPAAADGQARPRRREAIPLPRPTLDDVFGPAPERERP